MWSKEENDTIFIRKQSCKISYETQGWGMSLGMSLITWYHLSSDSSKCLFEAFMWERIAYYLTYITDMIEDWC